MNATNTTRNVNFTAAIVARYSPEHGPLAVLRTDEEHPQEVQAVSMTRNEVITLPQEVYKSTKPVSKADMAVIGEFYKKFANIPEVVVNQRQGYKKTKAEDIPSRLVDVNVATGDVHVAEEMIAAEKDADKKAVMEHINATNVEQKSKRKYSKKSEYWANPTKKRRAKPVEAQQPVVDIMKTETFPTSAIENINTDSFRVEQAAKEAANEAVQNARVGQALDAEAIAKIVADATASAVAQAMQMMKAA